MDVKVAECSKNRYESKTLAFGAAKDFQRSGKSFGWQINTYQCDSCRFPSGQRAWHWANRRPARRRTHR